MQEKENKEKESKKEKIRTLQLIEQNLQNLLMQKQVFQLELVETENALSSIKETKEDVFKIVGSLMIKAKKAEVEKELEKKKDLLNLRMSSIEKQEKALKDELLKIRADVIKEL